MILTVEGNVSVYYVQTLCLLFFPGSKFGVEEKRSPENPEAYVRFWREGDAFCASASLSLFSISAVAIRLSRSTVTLASSIRDASGVR